MLLVNGSNGIGTGWSSIIPSFNPVDIMDRLEGMLDGKQPERMVPWFKGFQGTVTHIDGTDKFAVVGVYRWKAATTLHITELPVGTWTNGYKEFLERIVDGAGAFKKGDVISIKCNHTDTKVFVIICYQIKT